MRIMLLPLLCALPALSAALDDRDPRCVFPLPLVSGDYGHWHEYRLRRTPGAGRFPISSDSFEVLAVDGHAPARPVSILVRFLGTEPPKGEAEVEAAGFECVEPIGLPDDPPAGYAIDPSQAEFRFEQYLQVTVRQPER